ncbi:MAG: hypothetical protein EBR88_06435 [Betaproteobacteria bacterium]|nr:hypothetical protein [Betaproteobacteria bacterium]
MVKPGWIPPASPYSLVQEQLFPNEWLILVAAVFLNLTTRKQVDRVFPEFARRWPTPQALLACDREELVSLISPLGFGNRRADRLLRLASDYTTPGWVHACELHGVGEYGARSWEIFCLGFLGDDLPTDGALVKYWKWAKDNEVRNGDEEKAAAAA